MLGVRSDASGGDGATGPHPQEAPVAGSSRIADRLFVASVVAAIAPIVVALVRAARRGWLPIGDNAYFAIRARDVLTEHHPLLGTWTSASQSTGTDFNNPGPLLFDLLALPAKLIGGGIGVAIGAATVNALAVVGIAVVARRRGGPLLGAAAMAVTAVLCWTLGSELLFDPWQPHLLLLMFLLGLMLVWSMACGDLVAVPWAVAVGSVIVQTHLSYVVVLAALAGWGGVGLVLALRRARRDEPAAWPARRRSAARMAALAVAIGALCWAQPVVEQLTGEGEGNLSRLASNLSASERSVGWELGARIVADIAVPPFWFRPSFREALRPDEVVEPGSARIDVGNELAVVTSIDPSPLEAIALLTGAAGLLALGGWDARRRGDRVVAAALSTSLVAGAAGVATAANLPLGVFGVPPHQFRWLWPMAAMATFAVVALAVRRSRAGGRSDGRAWRDGRIVAALAAVTVGFAVLTLPTSNQRSGPTDDDWAIAVMRDLDPQMAALEDEGTLLIDRDGTRFAEPFTGPVMAELQRRGIPFVVEDAEMARQLGTGRRLEGTPQRLQVLQGRSALVAPPGGRRVALVEGLTGPERDEHDQLADRLAGHLRDIGGLPVTPEGARALTRPEHLAAARADQAGDVEGVVASDVIVFLADHDLLELTDEWRRPFERFADLHERNERDTVALYLKPFDAGR